MSKVARINIYYEKVGDHIICRMFVNGAKSGNFILRVEEWASFLEQTPNFNHIQGAKQSQE